MTRFVTIATLLVLLFAAGAAHAQPWMAEFRDSGVEPTIQQMIDAFDEYWENRTPGKGTGYKQFMRWRWFIENRLDENGEFDPAARWRAWEEKQRMFPNGELDDADWSPLGPFNPIPGSYVGGLGRVNCVAMDPTNSNHLYAGGASGGLWESFTGGFSWVPLTDDLPVLGVSDIVIDPIDPAVVYMATGDADHSDTYSVGVLKSTDGGDTWNETGLNYEVTDASRVSRVIMHPEDNQTLLAATSGGIYKTTDAGGTWTNVRPPIGFFHDMEVIPGNPDVWLAAATGTGIFRSDNAGDDWTGVSNGLPGGGGFGRIALAISQSDPGVVYALYANTNSGFYGLYRSEDGGVNWSLRSNTPNILGWDINGNDSGGQAWYDLTLKADPENPDVVYAGGVNVWKSTDGGQNWDITGLWYYDGVPYIHADHHRHEFLGDYLYSGNDGGLYRTNDGGENWLEISHGMVIQQSYRLGVYQNSPEVDLILIGNQDNGTKLLDIDGDEVSAVLGGDGMECAIDPIDSDYMYGELYYGAIRRSTNGGGSWQDIEPNSNSFNGAWVTPFVIDPNNTERLWIGDDQMWVTNNRGTSWSAVSPSAGGGYSDRMAAIAISPVNGDRVYGVNPNGDVLFTTDGGDSWEINSVPASPATYIDVHPVNPDIIYVTIGGYNANNKVFISSDAGETWTNLSAGLPNLPVNCVEIHPLDPTHVYIGTDVGVFFSDDAGETWQGWSSGLPNVVVDELEIHVNSNTVVAATYGRGVWASPAEQVNVEPYLTVVDPNGGEEYTIGTTRTIRWSSFGLEGDVSVELNRDYPDGAWQVLFDATPNDWAQAWTVGGPASETARVRITSLDDPGIGDQSDENFSLVQPTITVIQPNGGEQWPLLIPQDVVWETEYVEGTLTLELNRDYPDGAWETIVPSMPDFGSITWIPNGEVTNAARFRVRSLALEDVEDVSDGDFSILNLPTVIVESPNGGETWEIGANQTAEWVDNLDENVFIEIVTPGGDVITEAETESDGSYSWPLSEQVEPGDGYTLRVRSTVDDGVFDDSDSTFAVTLQQVQLALPEDGGLVWQLPASLVWEAVPGADSYHGFLGDGPDFPEDVTDEFTTADTIAAVDGLENGEHYWAVQAEHANGATGEMSEVWSFTVDMSSVADWGRDGAMPDEFALASVYPNPFNPETNVVVALPRAASLAIDVFNINGAHVTTLADGEFSAGYHTFTLDGSRLSSGTYFVHATVPGELDTRRKLVLVR